MTRLGSLVLCATLGAGLLACGGGGKDTSTDTSTSTSTSTSTAKNPLDIIPADGDIPGWTVDKSASKDPNARAMTATSLAGVINLIDGGAEPYFMPPYEPKMFLWQNYMKKPLAVAGPDGAYVKLYMLHMTSAEQAAGLYPQLLTTSEYGRKVGTEDDWKPTDPTLGTKSRIQDTGTQWWVNFYKDVFYVEVLLDPSFGADMVPKNAELKQEALNFAKAMADRI
jgi:hypothetical protein